MTTTTTVTVLVATPMDEAHLLYQQNICVHCGEFVRRCISVRDHEPISDWEHGYEKKACSR